MSTLVRRSALPLLVVLACAVAPVAGAQPRAWEREQLQERIQERVRAALERAERARDARVPEQRWARDWSLPSWMTRI